MKSPDIPRSRLRVTLLVVSLLCLILTSIFLSRRSVHQMQEASASIYQDRLVPTALIAQLTAQVYQKRLLLEPLTLNRPKPPPSSLAFGLDRASRKIDSLVLAYGQTTLTPQEAAQFDLLKQRLAVYQELEKKLTSPVAAGPNAQETRFIRAEAAAFGQLTQTLADLSALQLRVGKELLLESRGQSIYLYVLTAIQMGLVLLIALCLFWKRF